MIHEINIDGLDIPAEVKQSIIAHLQLENPFGLRSKFGNVMLFVPHKGFCVSLHKLGTTLTEFIAPDQLHNLLKIALIGHREFLNERALIDNGKVVAYLAEERRKAKFYEHQEKLKKKMLGEKYKRSTDEA